MGNKYRPNLEGILKNPNFFLSLEEYDDNENIVSVIELFKYVPYFIERRIDDEGNVKYQIKILSPSGSRLNNSYQVINSFYGEEEGKIEEDYSMITNELRGEDNNLYKIIEETFDFNNEVTYKYSIFKNGENIFNFEIKDLVDYPYERFNFNTKKLEIIKKLIGNTPLPRELLSCLPFLDLKKSIIHNLKNQEYMEIIAENLGKTIFYYLPPGNISIWVDEANLHTNYGLKEKIIEAIGHIMYENRNMNFFFVKF